MTLIELMVVVAIVGILAGISLLAMKDTNSRQAIALAPRQLSYAMESARNYALAEGRDVIFLLIAGSGGATGAPMCGVGMLNSQDDRCVRYWLLEDLGDSTQRFDNTTRDNFDPTTFDSSTGQVLTADGDAVLDSGVLPQWVYVGRSPSYVTPVPSANSALLDLPLNNATGCSVCAGSPLRGYIRFKADGRVDTGGTQRGAVFYLNTTLSGSEGTIEATRPVIILQPSGIILDRI
jgi:prepilin-type N-terminal cleavage/methylation domain-containing protein